MAEGARSFDGVDGAWQLVADEATGAGIPCPPGWVRRGASEYAIALAELAAGASRRAATITLSVSRLRRRREHGLTAYSTRALRELDHRLPGLNVLSCDVVQVSGHEGRRLVGVYRDGGHALALRRWWTSVDGVVTTLSGTCAIEDDVYESPIFEVVAAGLLLPRKAPQALRR